MASKKDHIDEIIRQKLSQIKPEFNAGSWDSFARKLDEQEAAEDELLREKLSQIKPTFSASSWDLLSEQLAEQEHQEDEIIRNKISKIYPSYQEQSWQVLSNRIELQNRRAQTILDYKFIELSMFLLLLFVFVSYFYTMFGNVVSLSKNCHVFWPFLAFSRGWQKPPRGEEAGEAAKTGKTAK